MVEGKRVAPVDRNFWGVTFSDDGDTFYATLRTRGNTWLVRGDLADRVLRTLRTNAECPSLSPDGSPVGLQEARRTGRCGVDPRGPRPRTGHETVLGERRSVDDQVEWLDDDTLLYGLPREDEPGTSDVYALDIASGSAPRLFLSNAASPAVLGANPKP